MSPIEIIAVVFGLLCVILTIRQNVWSWPVGLVQVVIYIWVFHEARLYSDVILHVIYVVLQFYGWYQWLYGTRDDGPLVVHRITRRSAVTSVVIAITGITVLGFVMANYTDADLPYWDAAIAILSLIAQVFLARKVLESWFVWIIVDFIAIGVYSVKELHLTAGLYSVFLVLAITGWFTWNRARRRG